MSASRPEDDGDDVVERETVMGRYVRYGEQIGRGRFKAVYRGFDEKLGMDVAWAKIDGTENNLDQHELEQVLTEVQDGQKLKHNHVINYYLAWPDYPNKCINFITELFTSGNLRDYRMKHKHLGLKAIKKWARQLLDGLRYLHNQADGPLVHGDLRCDKIYINGHTGGIKIGDLGLATLLERRYKEKAESGDYSLLVKQSKTEADVYCFGLCILELVTLHPLDPSNALTKYEELLEGVTDEATKVFIRRCLAPDGPKPTAEDLIKDPFLEERSSLSLMNRTKSQDWNQAVLDRTIDRSPEADEATSAAADLKDALGSLRGDEWDFVVKGVQRSSGGLTLKLMMRPNGDTRESEQDQQDGDGDNVVACIHSDPNTFALQFDYDPDTDDPRMVVDELAAALPEMGQKELSSIDHDICVSALKECINKLSM